MLFKPRCYGCSDIGCDGSYCEQPTLLEDLQMIGIKVIMIPIIAVCAVIEWIRE